MSGLIPSTRRLREFKSHEDWVRAVAISPDKRRMVTGSDDKTLRLWDQPIKAHSDWIYSLDFSPDGTVLATGSYDQTTKLWNTKTWQQQGNLMEGGYVYCVRYSPSGEFLAIATSLNIHIHNSGTRELVTSFKGHTSLNKSLAWTPNGTRILSAGDNYDPTIREWDTSTWQQVGDPWTGHTHQINTLAVNPAGTLVASASEDNHVRLWRLLGRQTISIFKHSSSTVCMTFSVDGTHILSGGGDSMISEWAVPKDTLPEDTVKEPASEGTLPNDRPDNEATDDSQVSDSKSQISNFKILSINTTARNACIAGDLSTAEQLFTQEINIDDGNYTPYANRSFIMARKLHWDHALQDAIKSVAIQPSLTGYISKGIALCGKGHVRDARTAFDVASIFANEDITHFLLLIKAIAMFNADQHKEALELLRELAAACPNNDTTCRIVEAYLCIQLGINAVNDARHNDAADHFAAVVNSSALSSTPAIQPMYEDFVVLFGWDLKSLWQNAHQKRCDALLRAGRLKDALESYRHMMDRIDDNIKANCLDWSNAFTEECSALCLANGDAAFAVGNYDNAIESYSMAIDFNSSNHIIFANSSKAKLGKSLWEDGLLDAQKVIELSPSSYIGYELKHAALRGAQRYDEAIEAFEVMLSTLDNAPESHIRKLRQQYVSPFQAEDAIRRLVWIELENAPLRLLNTSTGLLCNRAAQINSFKTSLEYKELLSSMTKCSDLQRSHIKDEVAKYFRCVLLSHRWEETEALLHDIQDKAVYDLNELGGIVKLQSFCKIARDAGYCWAWMDTCCIDKNSNTELQESINSMFVWYRHSALTIVYLCDVPPSSQSGALASSAWNERGWTFQEFVAPKVVIFYQNDWSLYLDDRSPNHKESPAIMKELENAMGIDQQALIYFRPGMRDAREKLHWASMRITTIQEDVAYSLFGIFGITLPVIYGEKKQRALGRLLQEIVAQSGDITVLDWVGQASEFNSCLPASITSYAAPPCALPTLSEDQIQPMVSSLRNTPAAEAALRFYAKLENMSAPRFANCRLHLPCIAFRVTEIRRKSVPGQAAHLTYGVKADGLRDLVITTDEALIQFPRARPTQRMFFLVRPWDRRLLEQPDFADEEESAGDWSEPESPLDDSEELPGGSPVEEEPVHLESHSRALRLMVRLAQPFSAFLLAQQRVGEYKRIATDHDIIAQVRDVASAHDMMDIRTLEIL